MRVDMPNHVYPEEANPSKRLITPPPDVFVYLLFEVIHMNWKGTST